MQLNPHVKGDTLFWLTGDKVYLDASNIQMTRPSQKLSHKTFSWVLPVVTPTSSQSLLMLLSLHVLVGAMVEDQEKRSPAHVRSLWLMVSGKASSLGATRITLMAVTAVDVMATFHIFVPMTCLPPSRSLSSRVHVLMPPTAPSVISRSKNPQSPQILRLQSRLALHLQMTLRRCPLLSRHQVLSDLVGALLCLVLPSFLLHYFYHLPFFFSLSVHLGGSVRISVLYRP